MSYLMYTSLRLFSFKTLPLSLGISIVALTLSGCMGIYEGGFECPPGKGLGCTSISDVNKSLEGGLASHNLLDLALETETVSPSAPCPQNSKIWYAPWFEGGPEERPKPSRISRKRPRDTSL